jgi:hypothetical protein
VPAIFAKSSTVWSTLFYIFSDKNIKSKMKFQSVQFRSHTSKSDRFSFQYRSNGRTFFNSLKKFTIQNQTQNSTRIKKSNSLQMIVVCAEVKKERKIKVTAL